MREQQRVLKWKMLDDIIGSISIALVEVELFTSPVWLAYAVVSNLNSISGYSPAWIFGYWISIASYIGIERLVSTARGGEIWLTPDTLADVLISVLAYGGIGVLVIYFTISINRFTNSFPLALIFCISSPILFLRSFELFVANLERLNKMWRGV